MDNPPLDLLAILRSQADPKPQAPCLLFEDEIITFGEFDRRTDMVAGALKKQGVGVGDRVAILSLGHPIFFELLFGCAKSGAIMVPLNHRLSGREVDDILSDAEPSLLLVESDLVHLVGEEHTFPRLDTRDFSDWLEAASPATPHPVSPDDPVLILYTSGTTALPKGVVLSHCNLSYLERMARELWDFTNESVNLAAMPLFHIGGLGWGLLAFSQGGQTVLTRSGDITELLDLMRHHRVTHAFFVPTIIQRLVEHIEETGVPAPKVAHMFYGAAPIGEALLNRAIAAFGSAFHHTYGMTETAGTTVTLAPDDHDPKGAHPERLASCGKAMPWVELRLVDPETGRDVPCGEIGEIRMRSPCITKGYWRKDAATDEAITPDGWLCSGDAAVQDADGYIYLRDRYKNMIVSGGENIYPAEIDSVLQFHPAIQDVAVVGAPHSQWGETPHAYVVLKSGMNTDEAEVIAYARARLAHYKCPTKVIFVDDLPRNASGKILKRELRG
ncbi:MAG: AMP-binding protein [Novosphingobium sp.]|nr:AMP-binding protein [Novosphingobium sp.]